MSGTASRRPLEKQSLLDGDAGSKRLDVEEEMGNGDGDKDDRPMTPAEQRAFKRNWAGFFVMGMINNLVYVIIASAAKSIADGFSKSNLIGLITWANVGLGLFAGTLNTFVLSRTPYSYRIIANSCLSIAGLLGVAFAPNFWVALAAIVIAGASSSFGESVTLGYMRLYPSSLVNAWSSGTGMAGVGGSALYLLYRSTELSLKQSFLVTVPWVAVYLTGFFVVLARAETSSGSSNGGGTGGAIQAEGSLTSPLVSSKEAEADADADSKKSRESTFARVRRCFRFFRGPALNLVLVYFFEYSISSGFAAKVLTPAQDCRFNERAECDATTHCAWSDSDGACESTIFLRKNAFAIFSFCYQFGVLFSRSSLQLFQIRRIEVLTILQGINFVIWLLQAQFKFMGLWALFPQMVFVGLLGGASYVNVFYILLHDHKIPERDREFCINLAAMSSTIGITLAACFILIVDTTFLSSK